MSPLGTLTPSTHWGRLFTQPTRAQWGTRHPTSPRPFVWSTDEERGPDIPA